MHERDNKTRPVVLTPVLGDLFETMPRSNRAYSVRRATTATAFHYRVGNRTSLVFGGRSVRAMRTRLEISGNRERIGWVDLATRWPRGLGVSVKASQGEREASAFQASTRNNPLTRRFYQAAREERNLARSRGQPNERLAGLRRRRGGHARHRVPGFNARTDGHTRHRLERGSRLRAHGEHPPQRVPRVARLRVDHCRTAGLSNNGLVVRNGGRRANRGVRGSGARHPPRRPRRGIDLPPITGPRPLRDGGHRRHTTVSRTWCRTTVRWRSRQHTAGDPTRLSSRTGTGRTTWAPTGHWPT